MDNKIADKSKKNSKNLTNEPLQSDLNDVLFIFPSKMKYTKYSYIFIISLHMQKQLELLAVDMKITAM